MNWKNLTYSKLFLILFILILIGAILAKIDLGKMTIICLAMGTLLTIIRIVETNLLKKETIK